MYFSNYDRSKKILNINLILVYINTEEILCGNKFLSFVRYTVQY